MKHTLLFLSIFLFPIFMYGQKEATWWYFGGNIGMDFTKVLSGEATLPAAINGPINTWEGCFSISDNNGNFLLASDGISVYNKYKQQIATGLAGDPSSTQSGIVIPRPETPNQYYIVTVSDSWHRNGINYTTVDLSNGTGTVVNKNTPISIAGTGLTKSDMYENITSVIHTDGVNYWLAHRSRSKFMAWLVTKDGILGDPVVTDLGRDLGVSTSANGVKLGYLKFSPSGTKVAHAGGDSGWLTIGDFDASTGKVTNIQERFISAIKDNPLYGLEFSQDGKYLFLCQGWYYTLRVLPMANIVSGEINTFNSITPCALQLGPDNKIYGIGNTDRTTLWVIEKPELGPASPISTYPNFFSSVGKNGLGLPSFITSFFRLNGETGFCMNIEKEFSVYISSTISGGIVAYTQWNFGDGSDPEKVIGSGQQNKLHTYSHPGKYTISVYPYDNTGKQLSAPQTMEVKVNPCSMPVNPNIHMQNNQ